VRLVGEEERELRGGERKVYIVKLVPPLLINKIHATANEILLSKRTLVVYVLLVCSTIGLGRNNRSDTIDFDIDI